MIPRRAIGLAASTLVALALGGTFASAASASPAWLVNGAELPASEPATLVGDGDKAADDQRAWWREPFVLTMGFAALLLAITLVGEYILASEAVATGFGLATVAVGGAHYLKEAVVALRERRLAFVQLLVLAVVGAVALGVVEEAAMLVVVYSLGEVLEAWVAHRARHSLRSRLPCSLSSRPCFSCSFSGSEAPTCPLRARP